MTLGIDPASFAGVGGGSGSSGSAPVVTVSIELYDFGVPVHVQAPPAGEVAKLPASGGFGSADSTASSQ